MKNLLITGSTGFIGSNLSDRLSKKFNIFVTSRNKSFKQKNLKNIYFKNHDHLNKELKKIKIDIVIHCGTHYVKNHSFFDIHKIVKANIEFGIVLLENLKTMRVKKFINFSSIWQNYNGKLDGANSLYAVSKICFTKILDYYSNNLDKIKFYNLFISDTFGRNDKRKKLINQIKKNYEKNIKTKIISKKLFINLLNIEDILSATKIIINQNIKPGKYNVINNKQTNVFKLIESVNKLSNKKILIRWGKQKVRKEKIYNYNKLPGWKATNSNFNNLIEFLIEKP
jgi:nucleoside-diphosphate-sugar epimerase